jgi:hypothetical protein
MKRSREIMEILEAFDLTGSYRLAAELAGCDHHTVARYVALREAGQSPVEREHRARPIDEYVPKIEELVVQSNGKVRADVVHRRIQALGFTVGNARHGGWWLRLSIDFGRVSGGCFDPGCPSPVCGCSGNGVLVQRSAVGESSCGARG